MEEIKTKKMHTLRLDAQKHLELTGINSVDSFCDTSVVAKTDLGVLTILGAGLVVNKFNVDEGSVVVDGVIFSVKYSGEGDETKKGGFFKKLFQ